MSGIRIRRGEGPERAIAGRPRTGLTGTEPWYCVASTAPGARIVRVVLQDIDHIIQIGDVLTWAVLPEVPEPLRAPVPQDGDWQLENVGASPAAPQMRSGVAAEHRFAATGVSLDLRFDDGTRLAPEGRDQHGVSIDAEAQFASRTLVVEQWNLRRVALDGFRGRRAVAIEVVLVVPEGVDPGIQQISAWIDGVSLAAAVVPRRERPSEWVRTTRGTHSSPLYSRGNTLPAVGLPHGAIMATPVTRADELHWLYSWHGHNGPDNRPRLQALATTLAPSPWIGERAAFQVMPTIAAGVPEADRTARGLAFSHEAEIDRAHLYAVDLEGGIRAEMAPGRQAVAMRFHLPVDTGALIFDQPTGGGSLDIAVEQGRTIIRAEVETVLERVPVVPRMYVHAEASRPAVEHGLIPQRDRPGVTGYARFGRGDVELRIGVSFVSAVQAEANLHHDLPGDFDRTVGDAQRIWDERLSAIQVEGATDDQLTTLYSNLYRVLLFPNTAHESAEELPIHAGSTEPGGSVQCLPGRLTVNNGYWDTYRTSWPLLLLLDADESGLLLDGVVQHYRDTGWTTRWSAPGHVDVMVGTSSDAVLADAAVKGITGFDILAAYESALRNATVPPSMPAVGRKGLERSIFRGYTSTEVWEGMSWSIEAAINDAAIAAFARWLVEHGPAARREDFLAEVRYFGSRGLAYRNVFDPRLGFFQGREPDGRFRWGPDQYDPAVWGTDYVETNGWGMAFSAPHDGAGLAALLGGADALAERLEEFFAAPEQGGEAVRGVYSYVIHEISEAADVRMGMFAPSNQPAHHIPSMALFAGRPDITQRVVRESVSRLFLGSEIGQGYPGDEDNGEMSAWWLWQAMGLYPLAPGSPGYAVGSPLFARATLRLAGGAVIDIVAEGNAPDRPYVRSLRVNGEAWHGAWIPHGLLAAGALLEFEMGAEPSEWATREEGRPPSLSAAPDVAPLVDTTLGARLRHRRGDDARALIDDDSGTDVELAPGDDIELELVRPAGIVLYTVTPSDAGTHRWAIDVLTPDGWRQADARTAHFRWKRQTRPFSVGCAGRTFRIRNTGARPVRLAELELLAIDEPSDSH